MNYNSPNKQHGNNLRLLLNKRLTNNDIKFKWEFEDTVKSNFFSSIYHLKASKVYDDEFITIQNSIEEYAEQYPEKLHHIRKDNDSSFIYYMFDQWPDTLTPPTTWILFELYLMKDRVSIEGGIVDHREGIALSL